MDIIDMDDMFGPDEAIEDNRYNDEELGTGSAKKDGKRVVAVKRPVRNPQPKMDPDRLTSDKGIPALLKEFENVKFKGKGYEGDDLDQVMQIMKLWGHRMFPKLPFKDLLERIEKLGTKRPVQVCLSKIRLDMPVHDCDFGSRQNGDNDIEREGDADIEREGGTDNIFDKLKDSEDLNVNISKEISISAQKETKSASAESKKVLTAEQRERMERNRLIAEEKRKAKLAHKIDAEKQITETEKEAHTFENGNKSGNGLEHTEEELFAMLDDDMEL